LNQNSADSGIADSVKTRRALVARVGELATALGLTGWRKCEALEAAASARKQWIEMI